MVALARLPPESTKEAVIVCAPLLSVLVKLAPPPTWPSLSEFHFRNDAILPSSGSFAVPWKLMLAPAVKLEFAAGLTMVTVGGLSCGGGGASPKAAGAQMTPSFS